MRKRVTIAFLSIVCLLFVSGMLSFVELGRLGRGAGDILQASRRNIELAKEMLDAAHELNVALIRRTVFGEERADSLCRASLARLETVLSVAQEEALDKSFLDSLAFATTELKILVDSYLADAERQALPAPGGASVQPATVPAQPTAALSAQQSAVPAQPAAAPAQLSAVPAQPAAAPAQQATSALPTAAPAQPASTAAASALAASLPATPSADTLAASSPLARPTLAAETARPVDQWYTEEFEEVYNRLSAAVKAYMTSTQSSLAPRTEQMKKNAYRAVTPVLISLLVMIAIVLMLYYFMSIYCVNPILDMNRSLGNFLTFKMPFTVRSECKDEVLELKEKIDTLINQQRQSKS